MRSSLSCGFQVSLCDEFEEGECKADRHEQVQCKPRQILVNAPVAKPRLSGHGEERKHTYSTENANSLNGAKKYL